MKGHRTNRKVDDPVCVSENAVGSLVLMAQALSDDRCETIVVEQTVNGWIEIVACGSQVCRRVIDGVGYRPTVGSFQAQK